MTKLQAAITTLCIGAIYAWGQGAPGASGGGGSQELGVRGWLHSKAKLAASVPASQSTSKQTQSVSIDSNSTSLVDQTTGSDLVSAALNLTPFQSGSSGSGGQSGSGTVTASAYSIYNLVTKQDGLTPSVYAAHSGLRDVFFTLGRDQNPSTTIQSGSTGANSSTATSTSDSSGTIYGVKFLLWNERDAVNIARDRGATAASATLLTALAAGDAVAQQTLTNIFCPGGDQGCLSTLNDQTADQIDSSIKSLSAAQQTVVNNALSTYLATSPGAVHDLLPLFVQKLQQRPQLSLSFQSTQRSGGSPNDYFGEFIFDTGLSPCVIVAPGSELAKRKKACDGSNQGWMFTYNGSYKYSDSATVGADVRTARMAIQFARNLTKLSSSTMRSQLQFNVSGEGLRVEHTHQYRAQAQLVIPIANGIDLPLSFGYGNNPSLLAQQFKSVYGKFGLTFDFGKIISSLKGDGSGVAQ